MTISRLKKIALGISGLAFLGIPGSVLAQTPARGPDIRVIPPNLGVNPSTPVGILLGNALTIVFVVAAIAVLFMLIWGGFQWITSGGQKEDLEKAQKRITSALIGLALLALAFLITRVVGQVLNIDILSLKSLPTLGSICPNGQVYDPQINDCVVPAPSISPRP